ncbi:oxidoreductase [Streptomyces tsukubensis]|uniref:oxidoreductase n=1 Tax=Streptomyces tsukubensis TaxID=83656 RepID=UPI00367E2E28
MPKQPWTADRVTDQTGRTAVVTGANSGLGLETARALAHKGAEVVIAVRDKEKGERARAEIAAGFSAGHLDGRLRVRTVDLADLDSVRAFADGLHGECDRIDLLINNAGVLAPPRTLSPQGHETQFAVNYLGHFALTGLLFPLLTGDNARIVTVTSIAHRVGRIHWNDLHGRRSYSAAGFYCQSKLANAVFGTELHRRLDSAGSPVRSVLAHPGYTATNLLIGGPIGLAKLVGRVGAISRIGQTPAQGALPQLYAATEPGIRGGECIGPDGLLELRGTPTRVRLKKAATAPETGRRLWELSERLTEVRFRIPAREEKPDAPGA